jgi:hypothetical protein
VSYRVAWFCRPDITHQVEEYLRARAYDGEGTEMAEAAEPRDADEVVT